MPTKSSAYELRTVFSACQFLRCEGASPPRQRLRSSRIRSRRQNRKVTVEIVPVPPSPNISPVDQGEEEEEEGPNARKWLTRHQVTPMVHGEERRRRTQT